MEVAPGAFHLKGYLSLARQGQLAALCEGLLDGDVPGYVPRVRGGGRMRVRMLCLGRHWNGLTYCYEAARSDHDQLPVPALPEAFRTLAVAISREIEMPFAPDVCILNHYGADGRMGLHQDKDESEATLARGLPVVSVSIGDTARFLFGGMKRRDAIDVLYLESGDVFAFGGPSRLRYHGVARILPQTAPRELAMTGRFNLTFRQY
jgi:DNA alkylation damage repair protein AlkB